MTTHEFSQFVLGIGDQSPAEPIDKSAAKEVAQLVSGSLIYRLYGSLITNDYNVNGFRWRYPRRLRLYLLSLDRFFRSVLHSSWILPSMLRTFN